MCAQRCIGIEAQPCFGSTAGGDGSLRMQPPSRVSQ
jgi:hypothetical protein